MKMDWTEDGHKVYVVWDHDRLEIDRVDCPFEGSAGSCNARRNYCVVQRFVGVFGAEISVGVTQVMGAVEIAWIGIPGESDLDDQFSGMWIVPIDDPDYLMFKDIESAFDATDLLPDE